MSAKVLLLCCLALLSQVAADCTSDCLKNCEFADSCSTAYNACKRETKSICSSPPKEREATCKLSNPCKTEFKTCNTTAELSRSQCRESCKISCPSSNQTKAYFKRRAASSADLKSKWSSIKAAKDIAIKNFQYCYKDSYWRGSRVADCPSGYTNMGATCFRNMQTYGKCCSTIWSKCPCRSGWRNMGCHCHKDAHSMGMDSMSCRSSESRYGGRCYPNCNGGYNGELDTCWMKCPSGWTNCGMSCSKDGAKGCVEKIGLAIFDGVLAAGSIAAMIATGGASGAATAAANAARYAAAASKGKALVKQFKEFKEVYDLFDAQYKAGSALAEIGLSAAEGSLIWTSITIANNLIDALTIVDPTGLSSLALDLMAPKCNRLEADWVVFSILG